MAVRGKKLGFGVCACAGPTPDIWQYQHHPSERVTGLRFLDTFGNFLNIGNHHNETQAVKRMSIPIARTAIDGPARESPVLVAMRHAPVNPYAAERPAACVLIQERAYGG